ncbi:MAG: heme NO-binding domain-containing protein [Actinomycetota bacterium]
MYGMVNRAIKDLVEASAGTETWERICERAGLSVTTFSNTTVYDDTVTYDLVAAASEELNLDPADVLQRFGRHWILFTGREGWGPLFDMAGSDLRSFVDGLDAMHARVQASMPACRMPTFSVEESDDGSLLVEYRSEREGLGPMVVGLLSGLAEHFGESWDVEQLNRRQGDLADYFRLRPVPAASRASEAVGSP